MPKFVECLHFAWINSDDEQKYDIFAGLDEDGTLSVVFQINRYRQNTKCKESEYSMKLDLYKVPPYATISYVIMYSRKMTKRCMY